MKKILFGALLAAAAIPAQAQQDQMYLIKDSHVVAKYNVDDVDYISFELPDDVTETPLWINVDNTAKNSLTYSVGTVSPMTAYAHGIVSWNTLNNYAMSYYDEEFNNLPEGTQEILLKACLEETGYLGFGNNTFTMTDWADDGTGIGYISRFSVRAGVTYYVMAQEIDINTQEPKEAFAYTKVETPAPGTSPYKCEVNVVEAANEKVTLDFSGCDDNLLYCLVAILNKNAADLFISLYGADYIFNTWAYPWELAQIKEDPVWSVFDSGEYTVMVRGVDANGDIADAITNFTYEAPAGEGPAISIFSKSKENGTVSVNFEISPSNVEEAYVCLDTENNVDDLKNDGWELWEIASRNMATDITDAINAMGEYTFTQEINDEQWHSLLIYAKDKDGNRTVCVLNFNMVSGSNWDITNPASAPARKARAYRSTAPRALEKLQK